jgi:hypothetical protein
MTDHQVCCSHDFQLCPDFADCLLDHPIVINRDGMPVYHNDSKSCDRCGHISCLLSAHHYNLAPSERFISCLSSAGSYTASKC